MPVLRVSDSLRPRVSDSLRPRISLRRGISLNIVCKIFSVIEEK